MRCMNYIEQAIKDAVVKGGYRDGLLKSNPGADIEGLAETGYFGRNIEEKLLSPAFWQALGKARGWEDDYHTSGWRRKWHDLIDHLASGKDAESFFKDL